MTANEFPRPVEVARLAAEGETVAIEATAAEREAVRARLGLAGLALLAAEATLRPEGRGVARAQGTVRARVTQVCVVSLEPFETALEAPFRLVFRSLNAHDAVADQTVDAEAEDEVAYPGGAFDLGEAVVETLALALDPWPRRPGAVLVIPPADDDAGPSPFAAMARRGSG